MLKVVRPGILHFDGRELIVTGWLFASSGDWFASQEEADKAMLTAALEHLGQFCETVMPQGQPPGEVLGVDAEREMLGAIGKARRGEGPRG